MTNINQSAKEKSSKESNKGGQASSGHKAMETRAKNEGKSTSEIASEMGQKGGQQSQSTKNKNQ